MKYLIIISLLISGCRNYDAIKSTRDKFVKDMNIEKVSCDKPGIEGFTSCCGLLKSKPVNFDCYETNCYWTYPRF
jgi:hypothetical protein